MVLGSSSAVFEEEVDKRDLTKTYDVPDSQRDVPLTDAKQLEHYSNEGSFYLLLVLYENTQNLLKFNKINKD